MCYKKYDESQSVSFQSELKDNRCTIISTSSTKNGFTHYPACETEKSNLTFPDLLYKKDSRSPLQDQYCSVIYGLEYPHWKYSSPIKCWAGWKKYSGVQVLVAQKGALTIQQEDYYVNFVNRRKNEDDANADKLILYQTALKKGTIDDISQIQVFSKIDSKVTEEIIDNKKTYRLDNKKSCKDREKSPAQALFDRLS